MTLSDLERRDGLGQFFQADLLNNASTAWPRTAEIHLEIHLSPHVESGVFLGVSNAPPQGAGPQHSPFLGFPSIFAYTVWCTLPKFDVVTHMGRTYFWTKPRPHLKGPSAAQIWGFSYIYANTLCPRTSKFDRLTWRHIIGNISDDAKWENVTISC